LRQEWGLYPTLHIRAVAAFAEYNGTHGGRRFISPYHSDFHLYKRKVFTDDMYINEFPSTELKNTAEVIGF
jgi:hypothetical protein